MALDKDAAKKVLAQIDRNELAQLASDLTSIPSPTGQEKAVAEFILAWFSANGLKTVRQDVEVDRLQRAGRDQDLVGRACDAGVARELRHQEVAQRPVAERPAGETIIRERRAFARQHGGRRRGEAIHRKLVGVVVAADEIVRREPGPLRGRRRQPGRQQRGEIERSGTHEQVPSCAWDRPDPPARHR